MKLYEFTCSADQIRHFVRVIVDSYEKGLHTHGSYETSLEAVQEIAVKSIDRLAIESDLDMDELTPMTNTKH